LKKNGESAPTRDLEEGTSLIEQRTYRSAKHEEASKRSEPRRAPSRDMKRRLPCYYRTFTMIEEAADMLPQHDTKPTAMPIEVAEGVEGE
jgi:hypothetical protein